MSESLERSMGRIEGKLDMVLAGQTAQRATSENHETRITKVENWQSKLAGGLALAAFVIGIVVKALW